MLSGERLGEIAPHAIGTHYGLTFHGVRRCGGAEPHKTLRRAQGETLAVAPSGGQMPTSTGLFTASPGLFNTCV